MPVGDRAVLIEFGSTINLDINQKVHALDRAISQIDLLGLEECVPSYRSLLVYYDPQKIRYEKLAYHLRDLEGRLDKFKVFTRRKIVEVPVVYGGEYGPDLSYVSEYHDFAEEEIVRIHSGRDYTVYMIGFVAGFPYLGEVAAEIATPRLSTPRLRVPAGSVGIAEKQTGIYPCESPGGWQIIGRTLLRLFNVNQTPPAYIQPGNLVRFKPIGKKEFTAHMWRQQG